MKNRIFQITVLTLMALGSTSFADECAQNPQELSKTSELKKAVTRIGGLNKFLGKWTYSGFDVTVSATGSGFEVSSFVGKKKGQLCMLGNSLVVATSEGETLPITNLGSSKLRVGSYTLSRPVAPALAGPAAAVASASR